MEKRRTIRVVVSVLSAALIVSAFLLVNEQRDNTSAISSANTISEPVGNTPKSVSTLANQDADANAKLVYPDATKAPVAAPVIPPPRTREELVKRAAEQRENKPFRDIFASARVVAARTDGTYPITSPGIAHSIVLPQSTKPQEITLRIDYSEMQTGEQSPLVRIAGTSGRFNAKSSTTENALLVYLPADKAQIGSYILDINFLDRAREGQHRYLLNLALAKSKPH